MSLKNTPELQSELKKILFGDKRYFKQIFFLTIFVAILPVAPIVYMRTVFGPVVNSGSIEFLLWMTLVLIMMLGLAAILEYFRSMILYAYCASIFKTLDIRIFEAAFSSKKNTTFEKGNAVLQSMRQLRIFILSPVLGSILDIPISTIFILIIFAIHPMMGLFALFGATLVLMISIWGDKNISPAYEKAIESQRDVRQNLAEAFKDMEGAYTSGTLTNSMSRWDTSQKRFLYHQGIASSNQITVISLTKIIMLMQGSMLLGLGTMLTLTGAMDSFNIGNLIIAKFIGMLAVKPIIQAAMGWRTIAEAKKAYIELEEFLENNPPKRNQMVLPEPQGKVDVSNMTYIANNRKQKILDNLSFNLPAGSFTSVIGSSGSGKTTLARLLIGYIAPSNGEIRIDGFSASDWSRENLADHIGYLPQKFELFDGSIAENIARFSDIDSDKLNQAITLSDLSEMLEEKLGGNVHLKIDPDNVTLSRGEIQKIALARAFYGNPKYIVLDEPTSNLDEVSVDKIISSLQKLNKNGSTIVVMTHEKKITKIADYVLGLREGRQKLFGKKDDLKKQYLDKK